MKLRRIIALTLSLALVLALAAACKPKTENDVPGDVPPSEEGTFVPLDGRASDGVIYREERLDGIDVTNGTVFASGRIYYRKNTDTLDDADELASVLVEIHSADTQGGDERLELSRELTVERDALARTETIETLESFGVDGDGSVWLILSKESYDNSGDLAEAYGSVRTIVKMGADGEELLTINPAEVEEMTGDEIPVGIHFDSEGNAYFEMYVMSSTGYKIFVFDGKTGDYLFCSRDDNIMGASVTGDGRIVYARLASEGYSIVVMDAAERNAKVAALFSMNNRFQNLFAGYGQYDLFGYRNGSVFGITLEDNGEVELLSFSDSSIDTRMSFNLFAISPTEFLLVKLDWETLENSALSRLAHDPDAVSEKVVITLGLVDGYEGGFTPAAVDMFNRENPRIKIEIIDYSQYNDGADMTLGTAQLDLDIAQGRAPDIICFSRMDARKYIGKGILADLTDLLEADTSINRADMFENILQAGVVDGKLYHVMPIFAITTIVGKTSLFGDSKGFTLDKLMDVASRYPNADIAFGDTGSGWILGDVSAGMEHYIDWQNGTCSFDSEEFIALLNSAKKMPTDASPMMDMYSDNIETAQRAVDNVNSVFKENRGLLFSAAMSTPRSLRELDDLYGEPVSALGYPTPNGGATVIHPVMDYGITESSQHKEEAWRFISMLLSDTSIIESSAGAVSISRSYFEKKAQIEMTPLTEREFMANGTLYIVRYTPKVDFHFLSKAEAASEQYANYHLTQAEVDAVRTTIESATRIMASDATVLTIISEETEAFLGGTRSAEETARIIQSRVSLYVAENS